MCGDWPGDPHSAAVVDVHRYNADKAILGWHALAAESAEYAFQFGCCSAGKLDVLEIAYQTLSLTDAHVSLKSGRGAKMTEMHFLEYAHIGEVDAPMQSIVLRNEGGTSIDYRLDVTDVERLNA
ncbi:uncharacterized protein MONOS_15274 [Monocercomonoides exilis]|uniref:uncharacterized protein n=1 Tax=Monocercomonoides exilis TaxID=2049356 RepID=UPI00355940A1|nr:hypothetical protein MONOS_15274 [Monocercomonoides exilis]|eukprot:MONOS_15274.1-p1 / transcript=MONOS_15274.1 / gene=MONOS_15274 / organism=Monocercomonoides_exilis_PA203 / gene_product=unspecified product / transcript_product=unspecified product / location=Mono_scaffold01187:5427-5906(-) / protein_length=124 / sequence_SO=supercontig / SO=protein_coding / is_pseudo=false